MSFCPKYEAGIDDDLKFSSDSGTPVPPSMKTLEKKKLIGLITLLLVIVVVIVPAVIVVLSLPLRPIYSSDSREVPFQIGVEAIALNFTADVAQVNIFFEDLEGKFVTLDISATGKVGSLSFDSDLPNLFDLIFDPNVVSDVLTLIVVVDAVDIGWLNLTCHLRIDSSLNASLDVTTENGGIVLTPEDGVVFTSLRLDATTGGVKVSMAGGVAVAGDVSASATSGGIELLWDNVIVTNDVSVSLETTLGSVNVKITQNMTPLSNVTLSTETTTGGVAFAIEINGNIGAKIVPTSTSGLIAVNRQVGFSGTTSPLLSDNYPADSNFDVSLRTTAGSIDIDAKYIP
jgi:hypothetical protein